jgi:hypothetical protein
MKKKYRVWDGFKNTTFQLLTDAEVVELRRNGYYVTLMEE